jgi:hypothetical protein
VASRPQQAQPTVVVAAVGGAGRAVAALMTVGAVVAPDGSAGGDATPVERRPGVPGWEVDDWEGEAAPEARRSEGLCRAIGPRLST